MIRSYDLRPDILGSRGLGSVSHRAPAWGIKGIWYAITVFRPQMRKCNPRLMIAGKRIAGPLQVLDESLSASIERGRGGREADRGQIVWEAHLGGQCDGAASQGCLFSIDGIPVPPHPAEFIQQVIDTVHGALGHFRKRIPESPTDFLLGKLGQ